MTIQEAAEKWKMSRTPISNRCAQGAIPGARMIRSQTTGHMVWFIPDDAAPPADFGKRVGWSKMTAEQKAIAVKRRQQSKAARQDKTDPVGFVWACQDQPIKVIAEALGVPTFRIPILFDLALKRYAGKDPYAPQP